ncbi:unnamed protein product [Prorocentrum cordatum]|uniref:Fatty acid desaturase domain-containing protein n=1 Tax=Prorocentrum cordatum TaxID=2364126 RepID=A0ABN9S648_9DINO|nr:unnamed protein product [Polarella glacialis]
MDRIARFLVSNQHIYGGSADFYPLMALGRWNLYVQGLVYLITLHDRALYRKSELVGICAFFAWMLSLALSMPTWALAVGWVMVSHAVAGVLHVQIVLSHWSMETYKGSPYTSKEPRRTRSAAEAISICRRPREPLELVHLDWGEHSIERECDALEAPCWALNGPQFWADASEDASDPGEGWGSRAATWQAGSCAEEACAGEATDGANGKPGGDAETEWYLMQLRTTMNVATPEWLDWVHIGLQFQIEHHLFPRLPRHNLRKARELVKAICKKHDIHYHEPGFFEGNVEMWRALRDAAMEARKTTRGDGGFYQSMLWDGLNCRG